MTDGFSYSKHFKTCKKQITAFNLEAIHLQLLSQFGDSYSNSDTANIIRKQIYDKTGREAK